jgi:prepilin-type N-terminal cleavage/methylation domain-containing protein
MQKWAQKPGFTIVELLIVIVVIAILAAITIVAYNGIQNRAKDSALQSTASQAAKKVLAYGPLNTDLYPQESSFRTDLSLPADTSEATYDYYVSSNRKSFCISVTNTTTSPATSYAQTQSASNIKGRCIKNYVTNPSFEGGTTAMWGANTSTTSYSTAAVSGSPAGARVFMVNRTTTGDAYSVHTTTYQPPATTAHTLTYWVWSTAATNTGNSNLFRTYNSGTCCVDIQSRALNVTTAPVRMVHTGVTSANPTTGLQIIARPTQTVGQAVYYDGFMATTGDTVYGYGDGNSDNWSWVGAEHTSESFGPSLPQ